MCLVFSFFLSFLASFFAVTEACTGDTASRYFEVKNYVRETEIKKFILKIYHNFTETTLKKKKGNTTEVDELSVKIMPCGHYVPLAQTNPDTVFPNNCNGYL